MDENDPNIFGIDTNEPQPFLLGDDPDPRHWLGLFSLMQVWLFVASYEKIWQKSGVMSHISMWYAFFWLYVLYNYILDVTAHGFGSKKVEKV